MTLFRKPVKGDHLMSNRSQDTIQVLGDWSDSDYESNKHLWTLVTVTRVEPPKEVVRYVNYYDYDLQTKNFENEVSNVSLDSYKTRKRADQAAAIYSATLRRIACVRVVLTEGQFDD